MKALILPFRQNSDLMALRSLCPDFLVPLAGKPIVEHLIEQLVKSGLTDIIMLCDDRPDEVSRFFSKGERWGCSLRIVSLREGLTLNQLLSKALYNLDGMVLALDSNLVLTSGLEEFIAVACEQPGQVSLLDSSQQTGILAAEASILNKLSKEHNFNSISEFIGAALSSGITVEAVDCDCYARRISSPADLIAIQRDILDERLPGIRIPAKKNREGIWLGDHISVSSTADLVPPVLIGSYSRIIGNVKIGPNAVIASNCLINNSDLIENSFVMEGTAVGPHTELSNLAVLGGSLLNLKTGVSVTAPDDFILGEINTEAQRLMPNQFANSLAALLLMFLFAPLALPLYLISLLVPGMLNGFQLHGNKRIKSLRGDDSRQLFMLREFTFGPLFIRRWPGLMSVVSGHLLIAGGLPSVHSPESHLFMDIPLGLFHIWEVEGELPDTDEERIARENFHAVTRTFAGDIGIVLKSLFTVPPNLQNVTYNT